MKFVFFKSDLFWTQICLLTLFSPISGFYQNCNQIAPQTSLETLNFLKLERNLKIWLGSCLATSNFCHLTQGILEQPHILKHLSFLVKFVFFKSDLPCTQIWLSPRFSHISCFCHYCNQTVPQTPLQTLKIFKLGWNLKIWIGGSLAKSNVCVFTERGILE